MQLRSIFASTLSLALVACQLSTPLPVRAPAAVPAVSQAFKPPVPQGAHQLEIQQTQQSERLQLRLSFPRGFRTQLAQPAELAFVRVTLSGQGISARVQDGAALIPVVNGEASASFAGIPLQDGNLRLITVEGLNAQQQVLPSFEASGWYRSQTGVTQINRVLNRAQNVLVDVLGALLNDPVVETLDVEAYAAELDALMGYNAQTGEFLVDPLRLDTALLATRLQNNEPVGELLTLERPTQQVSLSVSTALQGQLAEDIYLVINDPLSDPQFLPQGRPSVNTVTFSDVPTGTWQLRAYSATGTLLSEQSVTVATSAVTAAPLVLNNSEELGLAVDSTQDIFSFALASDNAGNFVLVKAVANDIFAQRYASTGRPLGEAFRVNSDTSGAQTSPALAMDADGDFVVTWEGPDGDQNGIYAQRYNEQGQAQGSEFRVNTTTLGMQSKAKIAMDADGDFVVTWSGQDGSVQGIFARRYDSLGIAAESEFQVNTFTEQQQDYPAVAMDNTGNFVIAWESISQDGNAFGIYARRYTSDGISPNASEFQVNTYTTGSQSRASIGMDSGGNFVVAWEGASADDTSGISAQRYDSLGNPNGSEFLVNTYTTGLHAESQIAMDDDGDFVIVWTSSAQDGSYDGVYMQRYHSDGNSEGSELRVNTETSLFQDRPSVAVDEIGGFIVGWNDAQSPDDDIYAKRYQEPAPPP